MKSPVAWYMGIVFCLTTKAGWCEMGCGRGAGEDFGYGGGSLASLDKKGKDGGGGGNRVLRW